MNGNSMDKILEPNDSGWILERAIKLDDDASYQEHISATLPNNGIKLESILSAGLEQYRKNRQSLSGL